MIPYLCEQNSGISVRMLVITRSGGHLVSLPNLRGEHPTSVPNRGDPADERVHGADQRPRHRGGRRLGLVAASDECPALVVLGS